ncbi:MAG: ketopantoate reductase family protein, partial [Polyangiaceae bacterium]
MKVAIVGAGALGAVYGVRLAIVGSHDVAFVVREARAKKAEPLVLQRVDGDEETHTLDTPRYETKIPSDADVTIVTVRQDQLTGDLISLLASSRAPVVILTPMFPD